MRPIQNPTGTPDRAGNVRIQGVAGLRMEPSQGAGGQQMRPMARPDARAYAAGGIRKAEWWETGLSEAEAVYITRAHVLTGGFND